MLAYPPLPTASVSYGKPGYQDWAFNLVDPEGMPDGLVRRHGAVDWFAGGGTPVRAARAGKVVEVVASRGSTGQVFGGTVKVEEEPGGVVWVYRHVSPYVVLGAEVSAGQQIAIVTGWASGPSHLHLEIWRTLAGGYAFANAIDPRTYVFTLVYQGEGKPAPPDGNTLRLVVNGRLWAGWEEADGAIEWITRNGLERDAKAAISWQGNTWRGPKDVTNVCKSLFRTYLEV